MTTCHSEVENEKQNRMSFREDKTFTTSVYNIPIFSGVYTHFDSFLPSAYSLGTVYALVYRCFRICSNWTKLHTELLCLN